MKCSKCGKEIADGTLYCGYCGEKIEADETEPVVVEANEVAEPEEAEKEKVDDVSSLTGRFNRLLEDEVEDGALENEVKFELGSLKKALLNPFEVVDLTIESTVIILVLMVIGLFGLCGNLLTALIIGAMLVLGLVAVFFVEDTVNFSFPKAVGQIAQVVFVPSLLLLVMDVLNWLCIPDLQTQANIVRAVPGLFIYVFLGLFAIYTLLVSVSKRMKKVNGYGQVLAFSFISGMIIIFFAFVYVSSLLA